MNANNKPVFFTVTGADFGRSIAWAKRRVNPVSLQIRDKISKLKYHDTAIR